MNDRESLPPERPAIRFTVAQDGRITSLETLPVETQPVVGKRLQACVHAALGERDFPPHDEPAEVVVNYPIHSF